MQRKNTYISGLLSIEQDFKNVMKSALPANFNNPSI